MSTATASFSAGILIRRQVRNFLKYEQFRGRNFEWFETKGLIDSYFELHGDERDVRSVYSTLEQHYAN